MQPDTYYFSSQEALRVAKEQNRTNFRLQACYYNGQKIDTNLPNLINLNVDNLVNDLAQGDCRIPTHVDFTGLDISQEVAHEIEKNLLESLKNASAIREELNKVYIQKLKNAKLDFSQKLRVYLLANSTTRVMQYVAKDIADFFEKKGFDVYYNLLYGVEEIGCYKRKFEFNPHIIVSLNHLNNEIMSPEAFNFVWYQDVMPALLSNQKMNIRERDYIFTYTSFMDDMLISKGVEKNKIFSQQVIPTNTEEFYLDRSIKRESKIVFVGSKYRKPFSDREYQKDFTKDIETLLENGESLSEKNIEIILDKYNATEKRDGNIFDVICQRFIRNKCVEWMCSNTHIDAELYGYDWDSSDDENIIKSFMGKAEKEQLNKIYNSAKYALSASGKVINTQRLGEMIHAGAIPVVYDSRDITDETETWEDECLYFKTQDELNYILDNEIEPKKYRTKKMLDSFTYKEFVDTILTQVDKTLNKGC